MVPATPRRQHERRLTQTQIVEAALALLNEVGFTKLTVRTLAAKLNVQAAALYWHFKNKQALIDAMALTMLTPKALDRTDNWRALLTQTAHYSRRTLLSYRDGAQVIAHANLAAYEQAIEGMEAALAYLVKDGFTPELAATAFFLVMRFTLGCVFEEQADPHTVSARKHAVLQVSSNKYPTLTAAWQAVGTDIKGKEAAMAYQFERALNIMLDGIQVRLDALKKVA